MRAIPLISILICTAASASAQGAPYLKTLTVPPDSVGTCLPVAPPKAGTPVAGLHGRHISMKTREPNGERDIMVFADDHGRVRHYSDRGFVMTGPRSSVGGLVVAREDSAGLLHGLIHHDTMTVPAPKLGARPDTAAMRQRAREFAKAHPARTQLTVAEQAKIKAVTTWLLRRCGE